jgi:hypothetical protein
LGTVEAVVEYRHHDLGREQFGSVGHLATWRVV